jgi:hypothetical protein
MAPIPQGVGLPPQQGAAGGAAVAWRSPTIRGEPAIARDDRAATLYSVAPTREPRTMKQSFASGARLRGGGPILTNGSMTMFRLGSPPLRIVCGQPGRTDPRGRAETLCLRFLSASLIRLRPAARRRAGLRQW